MKLTREFSKETVRRFFGPHSSKAAAELKKESPDLYAAIRAQAQADGLVGDSHFESSLVKSVRDYDKRHPQQRFTVEQLRARAAFSEADCRELLTRTGSDGNQSNLGNMKAKEPERYNLFRLAAESFGLVAPRSVQPERKQTQPKDDGKFVLGEPLRDRFHLPEHYMVDEKEFTALTNLASELDAAKQNQEQK